MASTGNAAVYGGDEINAIVLDPGSYYTRIGFAGDDFPKVVTTSNYAINDSKRIFGEDINVPRSNYEIRPILKDSVIVDWDAALDQYRHYFDDVLKINQEEQPILITEPVWTDPSYRQTLVENFFEKFDFPALYLAKAPTCVSFQQGRPNCLVVDIGHDSVSVTPVIDGISLLKNSMKTNYAGQYLNDQILDLIAAKDPSVAVEGTYKIKAKTATVYPQPAEYKERELPEGITPSFDEYQKAKIWHEFKETTLEVPDRRLNPPNPQQAATAKETYSQEVHKRLFEFPTGQAVTLGLERFQLADSIFDPLICKFTKDELTTKYPPINGELTFNSTYEDYRPLKRVRKADSNQSTPAPTEGSDTVSSPSGEIRGLAQLITHTLASIDIDLRASVANNIIVTGGVSLVPQLTERLYNELCNTNPGLKIRLHAVGNSTERVNQAWIGGSVLASLGTFHQMWVSKQEYQEAGPDRILNQRFR